MTSLLIGMFFPLADLDPITPGPLSKLTPLPADLDFGERSGGSELADLRVDLSGKGGGDA